MTLIRTSSAEAAGRSSGRDAWFSGMEPFHANRRELAVNKSDCQKVPFTHCGSFRDGSDARSHLDISKCQPGLNRHDNCPQLHGALSASRADQQTQCRNGERA